MMIVTNAQTFAHFEATHSIINEDNVVLIFLRLSAAKQPTQDYATLAEIHRDLHTLFAAAGQPMNEYTKTAYFTKALETEDNPAMFQPVHLAVKDPLAVAGGNPRIGKCRIGHSVRQQIKIDNKKCSNAFINVTDRNIQNILSSTSTPTLPAPNLNIKTQQPFVIADSGSVMLW